MLLTADEINILSGLRIRPGRKITGKAVMDFNSQDSGGNLEFNDYQQFTPGENMRHIDWNIYMRDSSLVIRKYQKPERPEFTVVVDLSASVAAAGKAGAVKRFAAAICFCLLNRGFTVKLCLNGDLSRYAGKPGWQRIHSDIEILNAQGSKALQVDCSDPAISRSVIVVSDFIFSGGFDQFKNNMNIGDRSCFLFSISNNFDRNPDLRGNLNLIDSQNGQRLPCIIDERMKGKYLDAREDYFNSIEGYCMKMKWHYKEIYAGDSLMDQFLSITSGGTLLF